MRGHARGSVLVLAVLLAATRTVAQISPGPLSRAHAALEGSGQCGRCHEPERGVAPSKCLACHSALVARVEAGKGLHARPGYSDCKTCHVEHQGVGFDLVWWGKAGRDAFDHSRTGHPLQGRHARLACRQCHQPRLIQDGKALATRGVAIQRTYLGLGTTCASCHTDEHRGQFAGRGCDSCHDQSAWKPAPGFDHAKTSWPLVGKHADVACTKCHRERASDPANPKVRYVRFKSVGGQECASCHEDVHRGRLGRACATCHSPVDWRRVQRASFDHSRTGYPLEGRHASVACDGCHKPGAPRPLRYAHCTDCHGDAHLGQLARRADGGACESCHDVKGFSPARFGVVEHQQTAYPLTGAHLAVPCNACHVATPVDELRRTPGLRVPSGASGRTPRFRFASTRCAACHRDVHRGELDRWVKAGGCESCHSEAGWKRAAFDHGQTRFALVGAHARAACPACHKKLEAGTRRERLAFAGASVACEGCHGDPHRGQFRRGGRAMPCERCHASATLAASLFEHSRDSAWPLDGAHARVPCASCHRREKEGDASFVRYVPLPRTCAGCHGPALPRGKDPTSR